MRGRWLVEAGGVLQTEQTVADAANRDRLAARAGRSNGWSLERLGRSNWGSLEWVCRPSDGADVDGPVRLSSAALFLERADVGDDAVDVLVGE
jgi:hypothetical protein